MNIPMNLLKACLLFCAKNDARAYLTGVAINQSHVVATNGYAVLACKIDVPDDFEIIIPHKELQLFLSKIDKKCQNLDCDLIVENDNLARLDFCGVSQYFEPIDNKFVSWQKVIQERPEFTDCFPRFDWKCLCDVEKAAKIIGANYIIKPTGLNTQAIIDFYYRPDVIGAIMPMHWVEQQEQ